MSFIECNCNGDGSENGNCNDAGKCSCKPGFDGNKCDKCVKGFFGFPQCQSIHLVQFLQKIIQFFLYYILYVFYRVQLFSSWIRRWQL